MSSEAIHDEAVHHDGGGDHSGDHGHHDLDKEIRKYIVVFASLMGLTLVTVAISYLHLPIVPAVLLALLVASVKGSLVACYFMHLLTEKKLILWVLALTVLFFFFCLLGPWLTEANPITVN